MSLTRNQKSNLGRLFAVFLIAGFLGGIGYLVFWSTETSSVTRYCSGTTMITITQSNGNGQSTSVQFNDLKCK